MLIVRAAATRLEPQRSEVSWMEASRAMNWQCSVMRVAVRSKLF
jgi:hypothetical protein